MKTMLSLAITMSILIGYIAESRAFAADEAVATKDYDEMSLEELMEVKVTVASNKPTTVNRSPGIVTLITADDIAHMGARNLMDILMTVPGFTIAQDNYGGIGAGFRGLWAYEGKSVYLIDDQEVNDGQYGSVQI